MNWKFFLWLVIPSALCFLSFSIYDNNSKPEYLVAAWLLVGFVGAVLIYFFGKFNKKK